MTRWVYPQARFASSRLRRRGCGPAACIAALVRQSGGTWRPKGKAGTRSAQVRVDRSGIGDAFASRGLEPDEVFASLRAVIATDARMDVPVQHRSGVDVARALLPQLAAEGAVAVVPVDYSVVQAAGLGVTSFGGGHWVAIRAPRGGRVTVADSLRSQEVEWPVDVLVRAMERFGRRPWLHGRGEAIVVWPWRTWRQGYSAKSAEAKASANEAAALRKALAACEASK